eukprot:TRINITY_DN27367_c0_g1_i1.p1 TRINITY_DN27367_c0_g1~~TRINITY_DN27367_c0_g1_i1.p1  ORF type:complete len:317 (-),score=50.94 TRINITY_DN27367_c0_g1_i1:63-1013(-)
MMVGSLVAGTLLLTRVCVQAAASVPSEVEIAPGVHMPIINLGGVHSHPSNYSAWLELGGTGLDTALMYGDDVQVAVGDAIQASKIPRSKLFVTSKVPCCPSSPSGVSNWCSWYDAEYSEVSAFTRAKIDARLLGVEVVDLVLLHWPCATMEQTIATYRSLEDFALAGKARAIGISNFNASVIDALYAAGLRVPPSVNQCGFSIGGHNDSKDGRDFDTLTKCKERNITYSAYSPLGGLSGVDVLGNPTVKAIAQRHNKSTAQTALRWITQQGVVVVTASDKVSHLETDLQIFDFTLSDDEMAALRKVGDDEGAIFQV